MELVGKVFFFAKNMVKMRCLGFIFLVSFALALCRLVVLFGMSNGSGRADGPRDGPEVDPKARPKARPLVVVVGGGRAGTTVAWFLAHLGLADTVILEAKEMIWEGASRLGWITHVIGEYVLDEETALSNSKCALLEAQFWRRYPKVFKGGTMQFNLASASVGSHNLSCTHQREVYLRLLDRIPSLKNVFPLNATFVGRKDRISCGLLTNEYVLDQLAAKAVMLNALGRANVKLKFNCKVTNIVTEGLKFVVSSTCREYLADFVIDARGAYPAFEYSFTYFYRCMLKDKYSLHNCSKKFEKNATHSQRHT